MVRLEALVSAVEKRARDLLRQRAVLPTSDDLGQFLVYTFAAGRAEKLAGETQAVNSLAPVVAAVAALPVPEAGEALRAAVCEALEAANAKDRAGYRRALERIDEADFAFCDAGEWGWWHGPAGPPTLEEREAAAEVSRLDMGGYLLSVADRFQPRNQQPLLEKSEAQRAAEQEAAAERARQAARPKQAARASGALEVGEKAPVAPEAPKVSKRSEGPDPTADFPPMSEVVGSIEDGRVWLRR